MKNLPSKNRFIYLQSKKPDPTQTSTKRSENPVYRTGIQPADRIESSTIRIHAMGRLDIYNDGKLVPFHAYSRQKKSLILLKYLILAYGRWVRRETILEALWPDTPEARALNNLHALCFRLRKVFKIRTRWSSWMMDCTSTHR